MSGVREQVGKIRLSVIVADWSDNQTINPRLLAREVAGLLHTLPADQVLHESVASVSIYDSTAGTPGITHRTLADYFDFASQGIHPETITTSTDKVIPAAVFIARTWMNRVVDEATQRAAAVAGYISVANDVTSLAVLASGARVGFDAPEAQPPSNMPGYLSMRQAHQRRSGETSAAGQLDAALVKAAEDDRKINELSAAIAIKDAQITALREEVENQERETNAERRAKLKAEDDAINLEEQLEQVMGLAEFMNPDNKLSPLVGRQLVSCWIYITKAGTFDAVAITGRGLHTHCKDWLSAREMIPAGKVRMFTTALGWLSRKKGGAIAKQGQ